MNEPFCLIVYNILILKYNLKISLTIVHYFDMFSNNEHILLLNGMLATIPALWSGVKASYDNNKIPYRGESTLLAAWFFNKELE